MHARFRSIAAAAIAVLVPAVAAAQRDTTRVVRLDSLDVTVVRRPVPLERVPAAVSALDRTDVQAGQLTVGLDEALAGVPGVVVSNRYNFSLGPKISIRGFGARTAFGVRGVRVLADGIPLTMPDGQTNLNNLDLASAGRIEIIRGPASALYGNAAGGVISVTTEAPPALPFAMQARGVAGDLGVGADAPTQLGKLQLKAGGTTAGGTGYLLSLSRLETDGFRDFSAARQTLFNGTARFALGTSTRLTTVVSVVDAPLAQSAGALPADSLRRNRNMAWPANVRAGAGEATRQIQAGASLARSTADDRLDAAAYLLRRTLDNALSFGFIELERWGGGARVAYGRSHDVGPAVLTWTAGADAELQSDGRQEFDNDGGRPGDRQVRDQTDHVGAVAPFLQATLTVAGRWDFSAGTHYDMVAFDTDDNFLADGRDDSGSRTLSALSSFAGVAYAPRPDLTVFTNFATTFQTPTTTELINAPPAPGQPCCPGGFNPDLEPQTGRGFEVGARAPLGPVRIEVALFRIRVANTLIPFQVEDVEGREFFRNAGKSRHQGLELGAHAAFGPVRASAAYTLSDFTFVDDGDPAADNEGNDLPGVPPHRLFGSLRVLPTDRLTIDAEVDHTSSYFASDANTTAARNPAATVVDLRARYAFRFGSLAFEPFLAVNNVTDEIYNASVVVNAFGGRYFEPAPGRNFYLGATLGSPGWFD